MLHVMFATSSSPASVACRRQVFAHAHKRVKVYLCHFHVKDCWLKNSIKKVRINNARRQELLERLDKILYFNPGAGVGEASQQQHFCSPAFMACGNVLMLRKC